MQKILLLEDNQSDANLVGAEIKNRWPKVKLITVSRLAEARKLMQDAESFDVALFDLKLPDGNGMDLLSELREQNCETPIIIFTSEGSEEIATTALKTGANDYIPKKTGFQKKIPNLIEYTLNQALSNKQHLSVLYIEHHKSDIDLTLHHFKKYAPYIHLTIVSTGEEALNLLPDKGDTLSNFDVLLVDYNLPKYNALEISKIIRQERKLSIAMVIVTGQGDENIAVEALKLGVDDYVVKHENYLLRLPSVITGAFRRKELERQKQALTISETKYRLLADYASDCEYWINPKGEYIYISPACEKTTGYPQEAFIKNKNLLIEISLPEYREILTEHFTQKVKVLHEPIEFQILTADGKQSWISQFCQPVYDENNKYAGRRGVNRDIT
ncbi:MAG: response regulator, partial [Bacteroidales bacterium]|nr:response regulator [Bacteroidales bacterium]